MVTLNGNSGSYSCLSGDTKPTLTNAPGDINTLIVELDTGLVYYWNGTQWKKFGGD
jgi:hypothetical protein